MTATGALHSLETVRELCGELFLCLLEAGQESRPLDPNNLGDGLVRKALLTELPDLDCFRHQLVQMPKELVKLGHIAESTFNGRSRILKDIQKADLIAIVVCDGRIERKGVAGGMKFAVLTHAIAEPPFTAWTHAAVVILFPFPEISAPAVEFLILFRADLEPCLGLPIVDAFGFTLFVKVVHNTGPPSAPQPLGCGETEIPYGVPATNRTQKSHPMRESDVSASNCVQQFASWFDIQLAHRLGGELSLYVHSE